MQARKLLETLENAGWFDDITNVTCKQGGVVVVESDYGTPYATNGYDLNKELSREVKSFNCPYEGAIIIELEESEEKE